MENLAKGTHISVLFTVIPSSVWGCVGHSGTFQEAEDDSRQSVTGL